MTHLNKRRVLFLTFLGSMGTTLIELGLYFFTHQQLGFSETANLALALGWGLTYVLGALTSHKLTHHFGERKIALISILTQLAANLVIWQSPTPAVITAGFLILGTATGMMWPIIESYISSGLTPRKAMRVIGYFNLTWSSAVAVALLVTGIILAINPGALLITAAALNTTVAILILTLRKRPLHMEHDHPDRPAPEQLSRWKHLLASSRWTMLASYTLLFLLAPLLPQIFTDLGLTTAWSANAAAILHLVRFLTFTGMIILPQWHDRAWPLITALIIQPVSFFLILFGPSVPIVIFGEVLFGWAAGVSYFAALYYAQVIQNASVEAGGEHEGLIGAGFALGPLLGLVAMYLGGSLLDVALITGPFIAFSTYKAARALRHA
ncbi:MFS transporter [Mucisphaera sp.]|uniref:MFS transporter n=1 Tax=Mucisphaera sp. TaxID=2913024 RepID=UPI003D125D91